MKQVAPKNWEIYDRARRHGYSQRAACRISGISEATAQRFEHERRQEAAGGTSARRSSGWEWLAWRAEVGEEQAEKVGAQAVAR